MKTKITTEGFPQINQILLDEILCTYIQDNDCTESNDGDPQIIALSSRDGGGGKFINIKTDSWSIKPGFDDLIPLFEDFKIRMNTFNYINKGLIPKGIKQQGFKELSWNKKDLDHFLTK